jgi:nucleotide-binding universal stress UspA family protein
MARLRTILHPTDFSPGSAAAFAYARDLARDSGARLIVLHVLDAGVPMVAEGVVLPSNLDELREAAWRGLDAVHPADSAVRFERILREGPTVAEILDAARGLGADLIVMGTHGRTGLGRLLLGSVTEEVLRKAPCPVLTVKDQAPAAELPAAAGTAFAGV